MSEPKKTLVQITNQISHLINLANEVESDEERAEIYAQIDSMNLTREEKLNGKTYFIKKFEHDAKWHKQLAADESARAKRLTEAAKRMKSNIVNSMIETGDKKITTDFYNFSISESPGSLEINEELVPDNFKMQVITWVPDSERIKEAIIGGLDVPGCAIIKSPVLRISGGSKQIETERG